MTTILHIIDELKVGGAQTHLVTVLRYLRTHYPYHHQVISLFGDGAIAAQIREIGVDVVILDLRDDLARRRFDRAIGKIKSHLTRFQPDLVEAHLTWSRLLGLLAARLAGVRKRVGFEQGDIYMNSLKFRAANFASQLYTDYNIVCSDALRQWVRHTHQISDSKIQVFHNCVDVERFHPNVTPAPDVLALTSPHTTLFAMVGTLGGGVNKRVDVGIRALAAARKQGSNVSMVIAGDGDQRPELLQLAANLGVSDYVHFLGMRSDIPHVLAACAAFCHAAPFEPFGIVAIEAMAMSLPVVVPDAGGIHEAVEHNRSGFIYRTLDADALAESMVDLSRDASRRKQMGQQALCAVRDLFTVEQYVERLYRLYGFLD